jgi:hypothetical protein
MNNKNREKSWENVSGVLSIRSTTKQEDVAESAARYAIQKEKPAKDEDTGYVKNWVDLR